MSDDQISDVTQEDQARAKSVCHAPSISLRCYADRHPSIISSTEEQNPRKLRKTGLDGWITGVLLSSSSAAGWMAGCKTQDSTAQRRGETKVGWTAELSGSCVSLVVVRCLPEE
jgi:hypothetical protein